ncbi:membrane peptidoglycan carboxypeptidase [Nocardiopsis mwathae]|uniref:Membrane peptidoglycan carboxypeptidase n=1 Tax=Nocardiopsis mwathae TaxID=1472723 RepID=A0A7W9YM93_9ACTN|nr:transglycosylase domain-containing protein [Nocardiopsis mwathae]MBB6174584.1 membrane peptidoglycan carboxypeptidase [Nocardiopsis mwathae]
MGRRRRTDATARPRRARYRRAEDGDDITAPTDGGRRPGRTRRVLAWTWKTLAVTGALGLCALVAAFAVAYKETPDPREMQPQDQALLIGSSIAYADGTEALTVGQLKRIPVTEEQIPDTVVDGVLGSEQRDFYDQPGISPMGMARAVLSGGGAGGGSGITQQMARNYYDGLSQERSYVRKVKEILISIKVGRTLSPGEILTQYLNTIYFGREAYGVQAAAQAYFAKDVEDLDAAEGAFIGAIIQQPGNFENVAPGSKMEEILRERWSYAVDGTVAMHENDPERGMSREQADELEFPEVVDYEPGTSLSGYKGYIKLAVERELRDRYGLSDAQIAAGGYEVTTSLDRRLMDAAAEAFDTALPDLPEDSVKGLAAIDPATGEIRAFHGGDDFVNELDPSLVQRTQAGATFRPYVLAAALEQGVGSPDPRSFGVPGPLDDVGRESPPTGTGGVPDLLQATVDPSGVPFVEAVMKIGPRSVTETARKAGVAEEQFETAELEPSIASGTFQLTALDQASGFATFANQGLHKPRHMVTRVTDVNGRELDPSDAGRLEQGTRAFSARTARDATYAMNEALYRTHETDPVLPTGHPVAGVAGAYGDARSAWFAGYTPDLAAAVSLSRPDGKPLEVPGVEEIDGGTTSAKVWSAFMAAAMRGREVRDFDADAGLAPVEERGEDPAG